MRGRRPRGAQGAGLDKLSLAAAGLSEKIWRFCITMGTSLSLETHATHNRINEEQRGIKEQSRTGKERATQPCSTEHGR